MTISRAGLCLIIIISGLTLRRFGFSIGLPAAIVKYGGSVLWGTMVFFLISIAARRFSRSLITAISAMTAVSIELLRLVHTPWLDDFRLTLAGALLFGRIFSMWNIFAYGVGILLAVLIDRLVIPAISREASPHSAS